MGRQLGSGHSVYARSRIREALEWIATDLTRAENEATWKRLFTNRWETLANGALRHGLVGALSSLAAGSTSVTCLDD